MGNKHEKKHFGSTSGQPSRKRGGPWSYVKISFHLMILCKNKLPFNADLLAGWLAVHTSAAVGWWGAHAHRDHILEMAPLACSGHR
jgi:hypothetical protein